MHTNTSPSDVIVSVQHLKKFAADVFAALGMTTVHAELMAEQLAWAQVRGYPWLGAKKIIQYGTRIKTGATSPTGEAEVIRESDAFVHYDAHNTFSHIAGVRAMNRAVEKARSAGACVAIVRNTSSAATLGFFANLAVEQNMIGMAINNAPPLMTPWGGKEKVIGNQAFAIGSPAGRFDPIIFDTALSELTLVGIHGYELRGEKLPAGVALDADGSPTVDPATALAGVLLPMGGHRGSGLAIMWEVLTGILAGGDRFSSDVTMPDVFDRPQGVSKFYLALDPEAAMPFQEFQGRVDTLIERIHATPRATGVDRIYVPGERGAERARDATRDGVAIPEDLVAQLVEFGKELGVSWQ